LTLGRPGVLVDEQYGQGVIDAAREDPVVLAVPIEASGQDWFTPQWPDDWLEHVRRIAPAYAKVLVRDNPEFPADERQAQLDRLAEAGAGLRTAGVPLLYELLVPATKEQLAVVDGDVDRYDRDLRPELVVRVIADNQAAGVDPTLWKVEGLETVDAARLVAQQAQAGGRDADLIVLGRDAPVERLDHWLTVAAQVEAFVGFAIGRSIWQDAIGDWVAHKDSDGETVARIADTYLAFTGQWSSRRPDGSEPLERNV
jgi:myo-inositol catabolism protein IolC